MLFTEFILDIALQSHLTREPSQTRLPKLHVTYRNRII